MKRNIHETLKKYRQKNKDRRSDYYDLMADELNELYRYDLKQNAIMDAFDYGFILGQRYEKARKASKAVKH